MDEDDIIDMYIDNKDEDAESLSTSSWLVSESNYNSKFQSRADSDCSWRFGKVDAYSNLSILLEESEWDIQWT